MVPRVTSWNHKTNIKQTLWWIVYWKGLGRNIGIDRKMEAKTRQFRCLLPSLMVMNKLFFNTINSLNTLHIPKGLRDMVEKVGPQIFTCTEICWNIWRWKRSQIRTNRKGAAPHPMLISPSSVGFATELAGAHNKSLTMIQHNWVGRIKVKGLLVIILNWILVSKIKDQVLEELY